MKLIPDGESIFVVIDSLNESEKAKALLWIYKQEVVYFNTEETVFTVSKKGKYKKLFVTDFRDPTLRPIVIRNQVVEDAFKWSGITPPLDKQVLSYLCKLFLKYWGTPTTPFLDHTLDEVDLLVLNSKLELYDLSELYLIREECILVSYLLDTLFDMWGTSEDPKAQTQDEKLYLHLKGELANYLSWLDRTTESMARFGGKGSGQHPMKGINRILKNKFTADKDLFLDTLPSEIKLQIHNQRQKKFGSKEKKTFIKSLRSKL